MKPSFSTAWEREDYDREQRGELPLGPLGTALSITQEEISRLRTIETAARRYFLGYVQDEADEPELGVPGQHEDAIALKEALGL